MDKQITAKVKAVITMSGRKYVDFAEYLGILPQALQNKFYRGAFNSDDLIRLAEFVGGELAYTLGDNKIVLDSSCIRDKAEPEQ